MGAGSGPAGLSLAGADTGSSTPASPINQIDPVLYDPRIRGIPTDDDTGLVETIHWVDEVVALALCVSKGAHASDTKLGNKLRKIVRAGGPYLQSQVEDAVLDALDGPLGRKDIAIVSIVATTPIRGQIVVAVSYINLRKNPRQRPKTVNAVVR